MKPIRIAGWVVRVTRRQYPWTYYKEGLRAYVCQEQPAHALHRRKIQYCAYCITPLHVSDHVMCDNCRMLVCVACRRMDKPSRGHILYTCFNCLEID